MKKILFVEDSEDALAVMKRVVKPLTEKYSFAFVESAEQAIEEMKKVTFDLVISDLMMPGKNGVELFTYMVKNNIGSPFVLLTGAGPSDNELLEVSDILMNKQFHGIIDKPVRIDPLLEKIEEVLAA